MNSNNSGSKKRNKSRNRHYQGENRPKPVKEQESTAINGQTVDATVTESSVPERETMPQEETLVVKEETSAIREETLVMEEETSAIREETLVIKEETILQEKIPVTEKEAASHNEIRAVRDERVVKRDTSGSHSPKRETRTLRNRRRTAVQPVRRAVRMSERPKLQDRLMSGLITALKILLPVAACVIVIAVVVSFVHTRKQNASQQSGNLLDEPLAKDEHEDVNVLMKDFYRALADGDMDTVKALRDYNDETALITYDKKSEFIESYDDVTCYTKEGVEEGSYFVYVTYMVKIEGIDTRAPGLNAFYVYPAGDGRLMIDGAMERNIEASFKLVTSQDDVVDLYTKIDVSYKEALAADDTLNAFMKDLPVRIKNEVGEALALAQMDQQGSGDASVTNLIEDTVAQIEGLGDANGAGAGAAVGETPEETTPAGEDAQTPPQEEELLENKTVNQTVRATATVNVRSSDSEEADRIGRVPEGTELTRLEERVNGWSRIVYEGKEAFIKSDYLEVISTEAEGTAVGTVKATTNVNVRNAASQDAPKIGVAQAGVSYDLLEDLGEWYKINYNGQNGYAKAEFFE